VCIHIYTVLKESTFHTGTLYFSVMNVSPTPPRPAIPALPRPHTHPHASFPAREHAHRQLRPIWIDFLSVVLFSDFCFVLFICLEYCKATSHPRAHTHTRTHTHTQQLYNISSPSQPPTCSPRPETQFTNPAWANSLSWWTWSWVQQPLRPPPACPVPSAMAGFEPPIPLHFPPYPNP